MNASILARHGPGRVGAIAIALVVTSGGIAYAASAIPAADGTIHGCYHKSLGVLRAVENSSQCKSFETALDWNKQGGPGAPGPTGPAGTKGEAGAPGANGDNGAAGADGDNGAPGADAVSALTGRIDNADGGLIIGFAYPEGHSETGVAAAEEEQVAFRSPNVALVARDLSVEVGTAPGFSPDDIPFAWTFTLRDDAADTAVSCTVSGAATSCHSDAATALITAGSDLTLKSTRVCVPTLFGCPPKTSMKFGWRAVTAP